MSCWCGSCCCVCAIVARKHSCVVCIVFGLGFLFFVSLSCGISFFLRFFGCCVVWGFFSRFPVVAALFAVCLGYLLV